MSRNELTLEIQRIIESMPDAALAEVLALLREAQSQSDSSLRSSRNLKRILEEDKELLKRLAQ